MMNATTLSRDSVGTKAAPPGHRQVCTSQSIDVDFADELEKILTLARLGLEHHHWSVESSASTSGPT